MILFYILESDNPFEAWIKTIFLVFNKGKFQNGIWELSNLSVIIKNPLKRDKTIKKAYFNFVERKYIERALKKMIGTSKFHGKESYWMRLTNWNGKVNQIQNVVKRLSETPGSKHCSCLIEHPESLNSLVIMDPNQDWKKNGFMNVQPCLIAIDFKIRQNQLNISAFFRSQLALEISLIDYLCLGKYLNYVVNELKNYRKFDNNLEIGTIISHTASSFLYSDSKKKIPDILNLFNMDNF